MRFGVNHLFTARPGHDPRDVYREAMEQIVLADELGFHSVWLAEHHFSNYGVLPSLSTFGAAIAARTESIRIGTAVLVLPFGHPVRMAEEMAMLDVISDGRLDLGVGRGYQPLEFGGLNVDQDQSREMFDEYLEIMRLAWRDEPLDYEGRFYTVENIDVLPKPVQKPGPPIRVGAVSSSTFKTLGERGEGVMLSPNFAPLGLVKRDLNTYFEAAREAGHDLDRLTAPPIIQQVYLDADDEVARSEPEPYSMWFYGKFAKMLPGAGDQPLSEQYAAYKKMADAVANVTYERILNEGVAFGNPEAVIERMRFLEQELGTQEIVCWFNFGDLPHDRVIRNMRMFAEEVMPAFESVPQGKAS